LSVHHLNDLHSRYPQVDYGLLHAKGTLNGVTNPNPSMLENIVGCTERELKFEDLPEDINRLMLNEFDPRIPTNWPDSRRDIKTLKNIRL
jgi:hypothetical protein